MKLDFEGRVWQLEPLDVDMTQGEAIAAYTGLSLTAWYKSLLDTDSVAWGKSIRCLYWLMREQNGDPVPLESANFAPLKLFAAFGDALAADQPAQEAEPDPTKPAGEPAEAALNLPQPTPAG